MSRIGNLPITVPAGVDVTIKDNVVAVKGPKGEVQERINPLITVTQEGDEIIVSRNGESKEEKSLHGLSRSLINNMVVGVTEGYTRTMEMIGVGWRASHDGQILELATGFSHPIVFVLPEEIKVETKMERNKPPLIILESADKQLVGQVCAKIREIRKPEPYKGKGIKFVGEYIRRKSGKMAIAE